MSNTPFSFKIKKEVRDSKVAIVVRWDGELTVEQASAFIDQYIEAIIDLNTYYSILDLGTVITSTAARELIRQSIKMVQVGLVKHAIVGHTPRQRLLVETFLIADGVSIGSKSMIFRSMEEAWEYILAADKK